MESSSLLSPSVQGTRTFTFPVPAEGGNTAATIATMVRQIVQRQLRNTNVRVIERASPGRAADNGEGNMAEDDGMMMMIRGTAWIGVLGAILDRMVVRNECSPGA